MKAFHFALQPLRSLREHKENLALENFAAALRDCEEASAKLEASELALTEGWTRLNSLLATGAPGNEVLEMRHYCDALEAQVVRDKQKLETLRNVQEQLWQELLKVTKERQALERYFSRRRRAYEHERQSEQQKEIDEIGLQLSRSPVPARLPNPINTPSL